MSETTPAEQAERRERYAAKIRDEVRLRLGTNALALAERGQPVQMNFSEAATAADAAIAVADAELLAAATVPASAPTDRAAVSAHLWAVAEHNIVAEWICCEPINPEHDLCVQGDATRRMVKALLVDDPDAYRPAPLLDAVLAEQTAADRAAILQQEADRIRAHCPDHLDSDSQPGSWMVCHCGVADEMLRRLADAASGPGGAAGETQQDEPECLHCGHPAAWHDQWEGCVGPNGIGSVGSGDCTCTRSPVQAGKAQQDEQVADLLPVWEALYEPGNVSTYLIGYANDQDAATGMAEAWLRSQAEVTGRLEWVDEKQLATDRYDRWFELIERHDDGIDTGPGIVVRRRVEPAAVFQPGKEA